MNNEIKILGIIVTYFPDTEQTKENILQFIDNIDTLIIWENTPANKCNDYKIILPEYEQKIVYMGTGENNYIAYSLNRAVEYGKKKGYTHILTMDQDSYFETGHFEKYKAIVCDAKDALCVFGVNPNYIDKIEENNLAHKSVLITSGNIINLILFDTVGLYREDYKIDCVDYEFCYRAARHGIQCVMVTSILLKQQFGNTEKTAYGFHVSNYPPTRLYFIARNNIKLLKEYPDYTNFRKTVIAWIIKPLIKISIGEVNKLEKMGAILKGCWHGLLNK